MDYEPSTPPVPPKPPSHDTSGIQTPTSVAPPPLPPHPSSDAPQVYHHHPDHDAPQHYRPVSQPPPPPQTQIPDPGDNWLPEILKDKSIQDLATILSSPRLLSSLTHSPATIHPSLSSSHTNLTNTLTSNTDLATSLLEQESRLAHQRSSTQAQLLSTHTLERQWRQKQSDMDHAIAPFAPAALYQQLGQGLQEQAQVCQAMEESFLEGDEVVTEREAAEWVKRYREAKVLYYLRQERKERWDEGRVGGWR